MDEIYSVEVSVLLTVYNRKTVYKTIDSILKQTFHSFELLIVDNASDDGTYELLCDYADRDSRIVLIKNDRNMGQTYSLHRGMGVARGKYIARIDADDLMSEDRLEKQVAFLEANKDYAFCGSWAQYITDDDEVAITVKTCTTDEGLRIAQRIGCGVFHPSVMMRKSILDNYNISYDVNYHMAEDYDLWRQLLLVGKGINIPYVLLYYRKGANNDSTNHIDVVRAEANKIRKKICIELDDYPGKDCLDECLDIEEKKHKTLFHAIKCFRLYRKYLLSNIECSHPDYAILKQFAYMKVIDTCVMQNESGWARIALSAYKLFRLAVYKLCLSRK